MKHVDEYRQSTLLSEQLNRLRNLATQRWIIMDVCGGQTHALLRYGLEAALDDVLELLHGPGCPVCVTPAETISAAIELSRNPRIILASFGDMLRVPGTDGSLLQARTEGADIRMVYSPIDAVQLARRNPSHEVVFFAVGFETTAPATALALLQARQLGLSNFSVLAHHVRVEPAMRVILEQPNCRVQAFLAAGHVCTVTGYSHYEEMVRQYQLPVVVTGFEPVDLMNGLIDCVTMLEQNRSDLSNQYARSARASGNLRARRLIDDVFEVASIPWRGFGTIPDGGLVFRPEFRGFDARSRFEIGGSAQAVNEECLSADVLSGQIKPPQCPLFGNRCHPDHPLGAPMVSSEGACAAYFRYSNPLKA